MKRHLVGPLAELVENEGRRVEIEGRAVAVYRRGDRVYAVDDSCPHMGASLSDGFVNGKTVVCPWHGWTFDLETGASPLDAEERVEKFPVVVEDGQIYIEMPAGAPTGPPPAPPVEPGPGEAG
jgi:NAD(P)H-dependent nitrite reductase small subunit